jgi:hypothetical protein
MWIGRLGVHHAVSPPVVRRRYVANATRTGNREPMSASATFFRVRCLKGFCDGAGLVRQGVAAPATSILLCVGDREARADCCSFVETLDVPTGSNRTEEAAEGRRRALSSSAGYAGQSS